MCGIIGVFSKEDVSRDLFFGLSTLQHRGQESCGIAVSDGGKIVCQRSPGLVHEFFSEEKLQGMKGSVGIGHVRYSTAGGSSEYNIQPMLGFSKGKRIALAHNGNLINSQLLRTRLEEEGMMFQSSSDTEVILYLIARYYSGDMKEAIFKTMSLVRGAYSLVVMTEDTLVAVRDPNGFRPLIMGRRGEDYIFASENAAIDVLGGKVIRDIAPGEVFIVKDGQESSYWFESDEPMASCIFEHIYFARNDAVIDGVNAYEFRVRTGEILAREHPVTADMVVPVPDSGWPGAIGFAKESGIPIMEGLVKNRYVGRTFIKPTQREREMAVKLKLNPLERVVRDKSIVLVDDSIVRGTTSKRLIQSLREAGVREVHMRITSPPVTHSCYFGIDTPRRTSLIAANYDVDQICREIGADSLGFISIESLKRSSAELLGKDPSADFQFCKACFDGDYPIDAWVI